MKLSGTKGVSASINEMNSRGFVSGKDIDYLENDAVADGQFFFDAAIDK